MMKGRGMAMIEIDETWFQGALSVERTPEGLRPHRLPHQRRHLFPSPGDSLMIRSAAPSGVRLRFETDSPTITLKLAPLPAVNAAAYLAHPFDLVVDNAIESTVALEGGGTEARFESRSGRRVVEVWLTPTIGVTVTGLEIADGCVARPMPDRRKRWVTWGSSLTHCVRAISAAQTWSAIIARRHNLHLTNLGFGGECHIDPLVAREIRDLPADYISIKLGINTIGGSLSARTYPALVTAAIEIIREKHRHTPLLLVSPIGYPPHETKPNINGYTIEGMRRDCQAIWRRLVEAGDRHLYYVDGLRIFSVEEIHQWSKDQCHPNGEGILVQAEHWDEHAMPLLLGRG